LGTAMNKCPKCGYERQPGDIECPRCGIVYEKYEAYIVKKRLEEEAMKQIAVNERAKREVRRRRRKEIMHKLSNFVVRQKRKFYPLALLSFLFVAALFIVHDNVETRIKATKKSQPNSENRNRIEKQVQPTLKDVSSREIKFQPAVVDFTILAKKVQPAVVTVITYDYTKKILGQGSGFFIDENGHLITNYHVLKKAHTAEVKTAEGNKYAIDFIIAENKTMDLVKAHVNIPEPNVQWLEISKDVPKIAEHILVIGSPIGLEQTISEGIIAGFRDVPTAGKLLQISAPISPGSSGSPVVNIEGEVIGVATFYIAEGQNLNLFKLCQYVPLTA